MNELNFQKKLIDANKRNGGFGWKNNNQFIAGVCDITLVHEGMTYFIECKYMKYRDLSLEHRIRVNATKLQRRFLRSVQEVGGLSGIVTLIQFRHHVAVLDYIHVTKDHEMTHCVWGVDDFIKRKVGDPWPIAKILEKLI